MLTDLKPCPFCGAQPESPDVGDYFVECPSCGVQGPISNKDGQPHAKEEWNRRAVEAEVRAEAQEPTPLDESQYCPCCEALQDRVDWIKTEAETYKTQWAISCAEHDAMQAKVAILDGLSQVAIDGGWTYRGMEAYAKRLEAKVAELEQFKQMWAISCAERDALQTKVAEIEESARKSALNVGNWHRQFMKTMETVAEQYTLIEQCEQALEHPEYTSQGLALRRAEALAAIATHKKGIAK